MLLYDGLLCRICKNGAEYHHAQGMRKGRLVNSWLYNAGSLHAPSALCVHMCVYCILGNVSQQNRYRVNQIETVPLVYQLLHTIVTSNKGLRELLFITFRSMLILKHMKVTKRIHRKASLHTVKNSTMSNTPRTALGLAAAPKLSSISRVRAGRFRTCSYSRASGPPKAEQWNRRELWRKPGRSDTAG